MACFFSLYAVAEKPGSEQSTIGLAKAVASQTCGSESLTLSLQFVVKNFGRGSLTQVRVTVHQAFLIFGFSAVIFLPMLEMCQPSDSNASSFSFNKHYEASPDHPHEDLRDLINDNRGSIRINTNHISKNHEAINLHLRDSHPHHEHETGTPPGNDPHVVNVIAKGISILSIPPISVQWHRAAFENIDDMFWAIPNRNLTLVLDSRTTGCTFTGGCIAYFTMNSEVFDVPSSSSSCRTE